MARTDTLEHFLTDIADSIRTKTGTSGTIQAGSFDTEITDIPSGDDIYDYIKEEPLNDYSGLYLGLFIKKLPEITFNQHIISLDELFDGCVNLEEIEGITNNANGTVYGLSATAMFRDCSSLISIPLFEMKKVTNAQNMFRNCTALTTVPVFDLAKATNVQNMFYGCTSLTDDSLNNIMAMCVGAVKVSSNKTLAYLGLTSEQATTCTSLSNYNDFVAAGWTTGY